MDPLRPLGHRLAETGSHAGVASVAFYLVMLLMQRFAGGQLPAIPLPPGVVGPPPSVVCPVSPVAPPVLVPAVPVQPVVPRSDPHAAVVRLTVGGAGCTGTIVPGPAPDSYFVVSAAHCWRSGSSDGLVRLRDGRSFPVRLLHRSFTPDIAVSLVRAPGPLPFAEVAQEPLNVGDWVWHEGLGVRRPGSHEEGPIVAVNSSRSEYSIRIDASSGDSGSGLFDRRSSRLAAVLWGTGQGVTYASDTNAVLRALNNARGSSWPPSAVPGVVPGCPSCPRA